MNQAETKIEFRGTSESKSLKYYSKSILKNVLLKSQIKRMHLFIRY